MAQIVSITSGKGGVGKTAFAVNLAAYLSSKKNRVLLIDADLGLANVHILCGAKPSYTLSDYIEDKADIADIVVEGPAGVKMISGGSGVAEMANLDEENRNKILKAIVGLKRWCDIIIIDTAAGISRAVTDFIQISEQTIVICTPNFAAIADAYGVMKVVTSEGYWGKINLVVNRVLSSEEAEAVFKKLQGCTERFLGLGISMLGFVPEDPAVNKAVQKRSPFVMSFPGSVASKYLQMIGDEVEKWIANKVEAR